MKSDFVNTPHYRLEERRGIWVKFHGWRSEIAQRERERERDKQKEAT